MGALLKQVLFCCYCTVITLILTCCIVVPDFRHNICLTPSRTEMSKTEIALRNGNYYLELWSLQHIINITTITISTHFSKLNLEPYFLFHLHSISSLE